MSDWHLEKHSYHETKIPNLTDAKGPLHFGVKVIYFIVDHVLDYGEHDCDRDERIKENYFLDREPSDGVVLVNAQNNDHNDTTVHILKVNDVWVTSNNKHHNPKSHH